MGAFTHLKILVNLARIDGDIDGKEKQYIINIGKANGISEAEVDLLMQQTHEVIVPKDISGELRFEYIFNLVQLMKIDERLFQEEIKYCSVVASKLGYNPSVMFDLMLNVKTIAMDQSEIDNLRTLTDRHLTK